MAVATGWQGHIDTNLSFSAFFDRDHTWVTRFMPQFPRAFEGPLIAENGSGMFTVGQSDWHFGGEGTKLLLAAGSGITTYRAPLIAGRWYHLAVRVAVSAERMIFELYLNGALIGPGMTVRRDDPGLPRGTVRFGRRTTGQSINGHSAQYFGFLDDIAIFAKALSPQQITTLAGSPSRLTGDEPDLMAWFNLDGRQAVPKPARSVSLHGAAHRVVTSSNWNSAADAALLPLPSQHRPMQLPFRPGEEWLVVNGIETAAAHHVGYASFCWDFVLAHEPDGNGGSYPGGTGGAPLFAAAAGRISGVEDSNPPGTSKPNIVHVEQAPGEHATYLHVQQHSIVPALGEVITGGAPIARAGSTGMIDPDANHLHFTVADHLDGTPGFVTTPTSFSNYDLRSAAGGWHRVSRGIPQAGDVVRVPPQSKADG